jgi:branched-chain amino acid transport system permease protein
LGATVVLLVPHPASRVPHPASGIPGRAAPLLSPSRAACAILPPPRTGRRRPALDAIRDFYLSYGTVINFIGLNAILGLSLYVTLACGLLSLASAAFMGIGAYTAALLTLRQDWPFPLALLAGALAATAVALPLGVPVLRLRGVFLAISTIGFGEVTRIAIINLPVTGGALGLPQIPRKAEWWHIYGLLALLLFVFWRLRGSRAGYALEAIREDEAAARTMGINTTFYKTAAFVAGAFIAGLAGGLEAHITNAIEPRTYGFTRAVDILTYAVVGGMTSFLGPVLGAGVITSIPELLRLDALRDLGIKPGPDRVILNGLILLGVILFLPRGLVSIFDWRPGAGGGPRLPLRRLFVRRSAR